MYIQYLMNLKELVVEVVRLCALGKPLAKLLVSGFDKKRWVALQKQGSGLERNWKDNNEWSKMGG